MNHRHLTDPHSLSLAAIDDIIDRGGVPIGLFYGIWRLVIPM